MLVNGLEYVVRVYVGVQLILHMPLNKLYPGWHSRQAKGPVQTVHSAGHLVQTFLVALKK